MTQNILVIAPHPDDETLGCGGTLLRHSKDGCNIHWLIMTTMHSNDKYSKDSVNERQNEIETVNKAYNFKSNKVLDHSPAKLDQIPIEQLVKDISEYIDNIKANVIYAPFENDVHTDHGVVFKALMSSVKSFRSPSVKSVRIYETISETEFNINHEDLAFKPNLWIDISEFLDMKIEIMKIYKSEIKPHPFPRSEEGIKSLAYLRGAFCNVKAAESFISLKEII